MSDNSFYDKEMARLEREQEKLRDNYNSENVGYDEYEYNKIINSSLPYAPKHHQKIIDWLNELIIYQKIAATKNMKTHIYPPTGKTWHTHKHPLGCFMCEDMQFINVLTSVIKSLSKAHPEYLFP